MATKSFKGGMDSLLGGSSKASVGDQAEAEQRRGRKKTNFKVITKASQIGTKENETRATFIVNEDKLETLKAIAYWDRRSIKEVLDMALDALIGSKGTAEIRRAKEAYKNRSGADD